MDLTETHTLPVAQQRAWEALNDTATLRACIPGCESIEPDGDNAYVVALSAAVGPVKARFKGRMQLADIDAPNAYTIHFEGQGGVAGFAKGDAHVSLEADGDAATRLTYTAHAQVGGKLAQIGSRLVDGAARKIAGEFFRRFGAALGGEAGDGGAADDGRAGGKGGEGRAAVDTGGPADPAASPAADPAQPAAAASAGAPEDDVQADATKGKRSWTAWTSKS